MRAELLVLRKWPAAWGLLLVTPVLVLLSDYVAEFISYLNLTPADYAAYGTPAQSFPALTPSQFNIIAVNQLKQKRSSTAAQYQRDIERYLALRNQPAAVTR